MSALGHKQTSDCRRLMSAIPPKADTVQHNRDVRFVPKADIQGRFWILLIVGKVLKFVQHHP
jgi:hypothetical protein